MTVSAWGVRGPGPLPALQTAVEEGGLPRDSMLASFSFLLVTRAQGELLATDPPRGSFFSGLCSTVAA